MEPGQGHKIVLAGDSLDGDMSADAIRFEVIDDLPSVFADSVKFVTNDGEDMNYVHADHLGAPQKMTDADRSLVWDASFLPFGEEDSLIGSAANDNRFPGQRLEAETGLHYNYFRDYDPTTGRYLASQAASTPTVMSAVILSCIRTQRGSFAFLVLLLWPRRRVSLLSRALS